MSKTNALETALLNLVFCNVDATGIGDAGGLLGSVVAGQLYLSLHDGNPGDTGDQTTSEVAYTSYARVSVARSAARWTVTTGQVVNADDQSWPKCTGLTATATHIGIGTDPTGAGTLLYYGALTDPLAIATNITPIVYAGQLVVTED